MRAADLHEAPRRSWDEFGSCTTRATSMPSRTARCLVSPAADRLSVVTRDGRALAAIGRRDASRPARDRARATAVAANLAGGTHHAFADRGEGYCVFNDVAVATRVLQRDGDVAPRRGRRSATCTRATAPRRSSATIRRCSPSRCTARRTSRSGRKSAISTSTSRTAPATTSIWLPCDCTSLRCSNRHRPDLVFYLAGADPYEGDRLGRLKMTIDGLRPATNGLRRVPPARCPSRSR